MKKYIFQTNQINIIWDALAVFIHSFSSLAACVAVGFGDSAWADSCEISRLMGISNQKQKWEAEGEMCSRKCD